MTQLRNVACLLLLIPLLLLLSGSCDAKSQVHIVYFGEHSGGKTWKEIEDGHHSYLLSVKKSEEEARSSLVYSYKKIINGFSAWLTPHEAAKLSGKLISSCSNARVCPQKSWSLNLELVLFVFSSRN